MTVKQRTETATFRSDSDENLGEWREDFFEIKTLKETPEGYLLATATLARAGILKYMRADGSIRRELVTEEELQSSMGTLGLKPITREHPKIDSKHKGLVHRDNLKELSIGKTLQQLSFENGFVHADIIIDTTEGVKAIKEAGS